MTSSQPEKTAQTIGRAVSAHGVFLLLCALYAAAVWVALAVLMGEGYAVSGKYESLVLYLATGFFIYFAIHSLKVLVWDRPQHPLAMLKNYYRSRLFNLYDFTGCTTMLAGLFVFLTAFSTFKYQIAFFAPFSWDAAFAALDRSLMAGHDPWRIFHIFMGFPYVTYWVNVLYSMWFLVVHFVWVLMLLQTDKPVLRKQFFYSFVACWALLGSVLAAFFSSAGPVYFAHVTGAAGAYGDLYAYLQRAHDIYPLVTLGIQDFLWGRFAAHDPMVGCGISAMPSIHVATCVLMALAVSRMSKWGGRALWLYALVILLGSVHLGWHYLADGLFGAIGAWVLWLATGRVLRNNFYKQNI